MARLAATTHVLDPATHQMTVLPEGSEPEPHLAALVTNPACWEDGKLPAAAQKTEEQSTPEPSSDDDEGDKPAAKKAATRPARGRKSAGEGDS